MLTTHPLCSTNTIEFKTQNPTLRVANPWSHMEPKIAGDAVAGRTLTVDTREEASIWTKANFCPSLHFPICKIGTKGLPLQLGKQSPLRNRKGTLSNLGQQSSTMAPSRDRAASVSAGCREHSGEYSAAA